MDDTIFALSSGAPPAAIAIIRISGTGAGAALTALTGRPPPEPCQASLRTLRDPNGAILDQALVLWFRGPASATGEDCAELHCHGGRAVVAAVIEALVGISGMREAEPGEFTRRAFINGRLDLAQAEALGDLLAAETQLQRLVAQAGVQGGLSAEVSGWRESVLALSARVEALLDFSDEDDVTGLPDSFDFQKQTLAHEIASTLSRPRLDRLREGVRVVLAGPPNAGKSSLFNALLREEAAIVTAIPGTTRDVLERAVAWQGVPIVLVDTAGLRENSGDPVEKIGIGKALEEVSGADLVLWLGAEGKGPSGAIEVQTRVDDPAASTKRDATYRVSSVTGEGIADMIQDLVAFARRLLPKPGRAAVSERQAALLVEAHAALIGTSEDMLLVGENLRQARSAFDRLLGAAATEDMLDRLFARFCIGK